MALINILLIDDHVLFAKSMEIALSDFPGIQSFTSVQSIDGIIPTIKNNAIDVVLLDVNLGKLSDEDGLTLAKNILRELPETKILILTGYDLPVYRREAEKIGVKGFINKSVDPNQLIDILYHIYNGGWAFPKVGGEILEELTETEKSILQLLCDGIKRKDMAAQLYISDRTLSNHIQHIFEKLEVSSALEAVSKGLQVGYIRTKY
jgi:two-component system secretion system response regulator SalR